MGRRTVSRRRGGAGRAAKAAVACGLLIAWLAPARAGSEAEQARLEEANRRWRGARCRTRVLLELKKGSKDGWTRCKWLFWGEGGNERAGVSFSSAEVLRRRFGNGLIPPGTELVVTGWQEEKPGGTLFLVLEVPGTPVEGRVTFWDDWVGKVSAKRLDDFERWAQFELLELVSVPEEQLEAVPEPPGTALPPPTPQTRSPAAVVTTVDILAVAVEPVAVRAGDEVGLVVSYRISGGPNPAPCEVVESRRLSSGEREVAVFTNRTVRAAGTYASTLPVTIPADVAAGLYAVEVAVSCGASSDQGTALLQVMR